VSLQHGSTHEEGEHYSPSSLERALGYLTWLCAAAATMLVLLSLALTAYSVVLRYVFGSPVTWTDELFGYLVIGMVMLGAAESLRRGDHIAVDLLTSRAAPGARRYFDLWAMLLVIAVAGALVVSATKMVDYSYNFGIFSEGYLEMPMWMPQSVFLLGAALLVLMAVCRIVTILAAPRRP
jgi:TRAP-type C4-dicarboxylate transport system permease small subunit